MKISILVKIVANSRILLKFKKISTLAYIYQNLEFC